MSEHTLVVPADLDGERADRVVASVLDVARSDSRAAFDAGAVRLGDVTIKPSMRVAAGDVIDVTLEERSRDVEPDASVPFVVLHEDRDLIVVDKPIGVVVHPTSERTTGTLVHGLVARYPDIRGVGEPGRWGIVHRLDRDTSGALVVARTLPAHRALSEMIKDRRVERRYLTLVRGRFDATRGTIDAPIARDPRNPTRVRIDRSGRRAVTHYRRIAMWETAELSLLEVSLETGRTHQIRVHMAAIDRPIVGDPAYGVTGGPGDPGRPWLHARRLTFPHPTTGRRIDVSAPLPPDLLDSLADIGDPTTGTLDDPEEAT